MKFIRLYIDFTDQYRLEEVQSPINGTFGVKQSEQSKLIFDKVIDIEVSVIGEEYEKLILTKQNTSSVVYWLDVYNPLTKNYDNFIKGKVFLSGDINYKKNIITLKDFSIDSINDIPKNFTTKVDTIITRNYVTTNDTDIYDMVLVDDAKTFTDCAFFLSHFVTTFFNTNLRFDFYDSLNNYPLKNSLLVITYNGYYRGQTDTQNRIIKLSLEDLINDLKKLLNKEFYINDAGDYEIWGMPAIISQNSELFNINNLDFSIDYYNFKSNKLQNKGRITLDVGETTDESDSAYMDFDNNSLEVEEIKTENIGILTEFMVNDKKIDTNKYTLLAIDLSEIHVIDPVRQFKPIRRSVYSSTLTKYSPYLQEYSILNDYYSDYQVYDNGIINYAKNLQNAITLNQAVKRLDIINTFKVPYFDLNEKSGYKFRNKYITTPNGKGYVVEAKADVNNGIVNLMLEYYK